MRILFVIHQFFPEFSGGTERVTLQMARVLQHAGHAVHVLTCRVASPLPTWIEEPDVAQAWRYVHEGVPVTAIARKRLPAGAEFGFDVDVDLARELTEWMRREQFHVAHVMHTMRMATAVMAIQQNQLPYVVSMTDFFLACHQINLLTVQGSACNGPVGGRQCAQECLVGIWTPHGLQHRYAQAQALLAGAALRCVPSSFVQAHAHTAFPDLSFRIVPHGLDLLTMAQSGPIQAGSNPRQRLVLAYAGTLIPQKGLHVLIEALALIPDADLQLLVMGGRHGDPAYHQKIDSLMAADHRVKWMGELDRQGLFQALRQCDLLCIPSQVPETFSLIFHEAAALGVPTLVADHGAPADVVRLAQAGACVKPGSPSEWAQAVQNVLEDRSLLEQWRKRLPMPARIEEEGFFFESLYRTIALLE